MSKIFFKSSVAFSFLALTGVSLSSCSSSVSFYGRYAPITSNYKDDLKSQNVDDSSNSSDSSNKVEAGKSLGYEYAFDGYEFNNFGYSTNSSLVTTSDNSTIISGFAGGVWTNIIYPMATYITSLSNLYIMDYKTGDLSTLTSHPVIYTNDSSNNDLLTQFVYSWANVATVGKTTTNTSKSIKFGISGVQFKFTNNSTSSGSTSTTSQDSSSSDITSGFFPRKNCTLTIDKDKDTATYKPTLSFQIQFKLSYWDPTNSKVNSGYYSSLNDIQNKVKDSSIYDFSNSVKHIDLYLRLNYNFSTVLTYSYSNLKKIDSSIENSSATSSTSASTDTSTSNTIKWTDKLTNAAIVPTITFTGNTPTSTTAKTASSLSTIDATAMGNQASAISDLIESPNNDHSKVSAKKDELKNSLELTTTSILVSSKS